MFRLKYNCIGQGCEGCLHLNLRYANALEDNATLKASF